MNVYQREIVRCQSSFECSEMILQSPEVQDIILSQSHYDLIIVELFRADVFFAFGGKFNAPVISLTSQILFPFNNWISRNPFPTAHIPCHFLALNENMSLVDRIMNAAFSLYTSKNSKILHSRTVRVINIIK